LRHCLRVQLVDAAVFQHGDLNARSTIRTRALAAGILSLRVVVLLGGGSLNLGVAHTEREHAVDRDFMAENQVTHNGVGHLLRRLDGSGAVAGSESLDFDDVALLVLQGSGEFIESVLCLLAENGLSGTEPDFGFVHRRILVVIGDNLLDCLKASGGLLRGLVRLLGAIAGVESVLVGFVRFRGSLTDTFLSARIDVLDVLGVGGGQLVEFVDAVADRRHLLLNILFTGKGVQFAPETLASIGRQRLTGSEVLIGIRARLRLRLSLVGLSLVLGGRCRLLRGDW